MARDSYQSKRRTRSKLRVPLRWTAGMIPSIGRVKRYWRRGAGVGRVGAKRLLDRWVYNSSHKRLVRKVNNGLDDLSNSPCGFFGCGYPACSYCFKVL